MEKQFKIIVMCFVVLFTISCSPEDQIIQNKTSSQSTPVTTNTPKPNPTQTNSPTTTKQINYLALGDSYTIGQSVCETCKFPEQLKKKLEESYPTNNYALKIIAQTGWTTTNLISAIRTQNPDSNYDLVTLLIGVNNQYQGINFSVYEKEFPQLVTKAISLAKGEKNKLIVVSIPDYAYTPFGESSRNASSISTEIDRYNAFAKHYCETNEILFINITDITRQGLNNTTLVANDGLHPSKEAYQLFVERLLPKAVAILHN